jgi:phage terminase Nu1 subunit (DNA packaging protein)
MRIDIHHYFSLQQGDMIMATLQELKDKLVELGAAIKAEKVKDETEKTATEATLAGLKADIQTLKDQLATGVLVTQADLDTLFASVGDLITGVQSINTTSTTPTA